MLSYRHGFHAGNFADVHKHVALLLLLEHLLQKPAPFYFIDSHAGAGRYDLHSTFARKHCEYDTGIGRLWPLPQVPDAIGRYLDLVRGCNRQQTGTEDVLRFYPGSPWIAHRLLRADDRMVLAELHNTEAPLLKQVFRSDGRVAIHHRDGYEALPGLVPPPSRRGVVLIDPSYELRDEFIQVTQCLERAWRRWAAGIYLLWYPLHRRQPTLAFHRALRRSGIRRILVSELGINDSRLPNRLAGSGLVIINPPWHFETDFAGITLWLEKLLATPGHTAADTRWLVAE